MGRPYDIQWEAGVTLSYSYFTTLFSSQHEREQRASLRNHPLRSMSFRLLMEILDASKVENRLIKYHQQEFVIPIFPERFECSNAGSLLGVTVINSDDIEFFYNLQKVNCADLASTGGGLIVADRTGTIEAKVYEILSLTTTTVTLKAPIADALDGGNAEFYPAMSAYLDGYGKSMVTDGVFEFDIKVKEKQSWLIQSQILGAQPLFLF